jgi:uncharacterized SAM-binding protein YcdF (DUF218 family)
MLNSRWQAESKLIEEDRGQVPDDRCQSSEVGAELTGAVKSAQKLCGLFVRKERWGLSWRGWLLFVLGALLTAYLVFANAHPFLAVTRRVNTDILVVEGWIHGYGIHAAVVEFKNGAYQYAFSTGGPVTGNGGYVNDFQTSASVGAELLKESGIPLESLEMVPSHVIGRDRTYSSAVALREWLREHNGAVRSFNVVTEDTHARRTRLLFQEAFGNETKVGIISVPNPDYDAKHWWQYSEGVRDVLSEGVAYLYAKFFFWPATRDHKTTGQLDNRTIGQQDNRRKTTGK